MIQTHADYTGSELARQVLNSWDELLPKFVKVLPHDYKRMLEAFAQVQAEGLERRRSGDGGV